MSYSIFENTLTARTLWRDLYIRTTYNWQKLHLLVHSPFRASLTLSFYISHPSISAFLPKFLRKISILGLLKICTPVCKSRFAVNALRRQVSHSSLADYNEDRVVQNSCRTHKNQVVQWNNLCWLWSWTCPWSTLCSGCPWSQPPSWSTWCSWWSGSCPWAPWDHSGQLLFITFCDLGIFQKFPDSAFCT